MQVEMWERITVALAELGPAALAVSEEQRGAASGEASEPMTEEGLVEYEGMLISVAAAQRRRHERCIAVTFDRRVHPKLWFRPTHLAKPEVKSLQRLRLIAGR